MRFLIFTVFLFVAAVEIVAQELSKDCVTNHTAPPVSFYYWPPDTNVKVYFKRGMFTVAQQATLFAAMETWSNAGGETGAGVSFTYFGEVDQLADCNGCLTVTRREVNKYDRKHYAFFNPLKQSSDGLLVSAWIDFDFATTKPQALQGFMAHELGHGMGLDDARKQRLVTDIADYQRRSFRQRQEEPGRQIVDHDDGLARVHQRMHHVAADIAAATCHQNGHRSSSRAKQLKQFRMRWSRNYA